MKKLAIYLSVLIGIFLFCLRCDIDIFSPGEPESSAYEPQIKGSLEAKINGELMIFDEVKVWPDHAWSSGCYMTCGIKASKSMNNTIYEINIYLNERSEGFIPCITNFTKVGTFDIYQADYNIFYDNYTVSEFYSTIHNCDEDGIQYHEEGKITISSILSDRYRGTFSFIASDGCGDVQFSITEGKFEITREPEPVCE